MTLAHISDTHLGYRAYGKTAPNGFNQRELDVMITFQRCLESILERDPDIVIHSGDVFHVVRPSNATIVEAYRSLAAFQKKRKGKPFVMIGGNHDSPRTVESGSILRLFSAIEGVIVETSDANTVLIDDFEVLCIPSNSLVRGENYEMVPRGEAKYSILTLHGMAREVLPDHSDFMVAEANAERWTYAAFGDYHIHQSYGANICYAGSTEFTSTNIWEESSRPKGWVYFDTEGKGLEHVPVQTRRVLDLPSINAADLTADQLLAKMAEAVTWSVDEAPIVRQKVTNLHPDVRSGIPVNALRELNATCLYYRFMPVAPVGAASEGTLRLGQAVTLEQSWEGHVLELDLPPGIERDRVRTLGLDLLREVVEHEVTPVEA